MSLRADTILHTVDEVGYCVVPELLDPGVAERARLVLTSLESRQQATGSTVRSTRNVMAKHELFRELARHPFVVGLMRRYLGEDMVCSSCTGVTLLPGHSGSGWHVDYPYWSIRPPYPPWNLAAYALWMLDDFTEENGATAVIPGSHRRDHPPDLEPGAWPSDAVVATGSKGSVLLAHGAYWHTARANLGAASRSAVVVAYLRSFCIPHTDMAQQLDKLDQPTADEQRLYCAEQFVPHQEP